MLNDDLIAYLQPAPNRLNPHEWHDVTGGITDIRVEPHRFTLRANLPPGLYRCALETEPGAFDMQTAMVEMVRVPDGKRVPVGPWDLDHVHGVMAMPMARTFVNGKLKGGLWFAMPGPEQIAEGRLEADFGFEAEGESTELTLELTERDRQRMDWGRIRYMEFRRDDRRLCPLLPRTERHPRVYVNADEIEGLRERLLPDPLFRAKAEQLKRVEDLNTGTEFGGNLESACLHYLLTRDQELGLKIKSTILEMCRMPTWSRYPDPLLMGGDNDRGIGWRLFAVGLAWDYGSALFSEAERRVILDKVEEYLRKMYDFTVLQRAYMGCPTSDPHSIGTWNGVGVACMAFYDELPIARHALPFFNGLFHDSLRLFPPGGKTLWTYYFPAHLVRYLAAAHTFGGLQTELNRSSFLDKLARTLSASLETPTAAELARGLRTIEHRYLTAFLCRFHPTEGIEAIYQAFVEREQEAAGDVALGLFDFLHAPAKKAVPASFPTMQVFSRDIGELMCMARDRKTMGCLVSAGLKAGNRASFSLKPHNREYAPSLANIEVSVDGTPVLVNIVGYGLNSALSNAMCFEDGGALTNGQYLNGRIGPETSSYIRRCLIEDRFVYAHAVITQALHPRLQVRQAERLMVFDSLNGIVVLADSFAGNHPLRFATHLHCSGSVTDLSGGRYRMTGGQANLMAGIRGGSKGLSNEENGELFVSVLNDMSRQRVLVEEPFWVPTYTSGLNSAGQESLRDGKFPRYRRWRLEETQPVAGGEFLFALSAEADAVSRDGEQIVLPGSARIVLAAGKAVQAVGCECEAEAVLVDESTGKLVVIGARKVATGSREMAFAVPVDIELQGSRGTIYSPAQDPGVQTRGWQLGRFEYQPHHSRSTWYWSAQLRA